MRKLVIVSDSPPLVLFRNFSCLYDDAFQELSKRLDLGLCRVEEVRAAMAEKTKGLPTEVR